AVIGAGTMGNGIAHLFALYGHRVVLIDVDPSALDRARETIAANLERQLRKGVIQAGEREAALDRIEAGLELARAGTADLVIEAASENREVKFRLFEALDGIAPPHAILATNTSSISITSIAARTRRPDRVIGMHFMNPVPVMELVEVI